MCEFFITFAYKNDPLDKTGQIHVLYLKMKSRLLYIFMDHIFLPISLQTRLCCLRV